MLELAIAAWLTAFASCSITLFFSAMVRSAEQVMPVIVVRTMAQLVLCGVMIPVTDRPMLSQLSWIAPARWRYAAGASTVDVTSVVPGVPNDTLWRQAGPWRMSSALVLVLLTLVFVLLLTRRLTRLRAG